MMIYIYCPKIKVHHQVIILRLSNREKLLRTINTYILRNLKHGESREVERPHNKVCSLLLVLLIAFSAFTYLIYLLFNFEYFLIFI